MTDELIADIDSIIKLKETRCKKRTAEFTPSKKLQSFYSKRTKLEEDKNVQIQKLIADFEDQFLKDNQQFFKNLSSLETLENTEFQKQNERDKMQLEELIHFKSTIEKAMAHWISQTKAYLEIEKDREIK